MPSLVEHAAAHLVAINLTTAPNDERVRRADALAEEAATIGAGCGASGSDGERAAEAIRDTRRITASPSASEKSDGGTIPVPVRRTHPASKRWSRPR